MKTFESRIPKAGTRNSTVTSATRKAASVISSSSTSSSSQSTNSSRTTTNRLRSSRINRTAARSRSDSTPRRPFSRHSKFVSAIPSPQDPPKIVSPRASETRDEPDMSPKSDQYERDEEQDITPLFRITVVENRSDDSQERQFKLAAQKLAQIWLNESDEDDTMLDVSHVPDTQVDGDSVLESKREIGFHSIAAIPIGIERTVSALDAETQSSNVADAALTQHKLHKFFSSLQDETDSEDDDNSTIQEEEHVENMSSSDEEMVLNPLVRAARLRRGSFAAEVSNSSPAVEAAVEAAAPVEAPATLPLPQVDRHVQELINDDGPEEILQTQPVNTTEDSPWKQALDEVNLLRKDSQLKEAQQASPKQSIYDNPDYVNTILSNGDCVDNGSIFTLVEQDTTTTTCNSSESIGFSKSMGDEFVQQPSLEQQQQQQRPTIWSALAHINENKEGQFVLPPWSKDESVKQADTGSNKNANDNINTRNHGNVAPLNREARRQQPEDGSCTDGQDALRQPPVRNKGHGSTTGSDATDEIASDTDNNTSTDGDAVSSTPEHGNPERPTTSRQLPFDEQKQDRSAAFDVAEAYDSFALADHTSSISTWRTQAGRSASDMTVEVQQMSSGNVHVYNVHKHIVGVGPRRSDSLHKVIEGHASAASATDDPALTTRLVLEDDAATLFPMVLDYIYQFNDNDNITITSDTAVALLHLCGELEMDALVEQVSWFILNDINLSNLQTYMEHAILCRNANVACLACEKCAMNIMKIEPSDVLWTIITPFIFCRIIASPVIVRDIASCHLSMLIAEFHSIQNYAIDMEMFQRMTSDEYLPSIDQKAVLPLLEIVQNHYDAVNTFESLQKRCTTAMAQNWSVVSDGERHRFFAFLRPLPSSFTVDFLEMVEANRRSSPKHSQDSKRGRQKRASQDGSIPDEDADNASQFTSTVPYHPSTYGFFESVNGEEKVLPKLNWRMDRNVSYSDCMLEVRTMKLGEPQTYALHKHMLCVGPRRSELFVDMFSNASESKPSTDATAAATDKVLASQFVQSHHRGHHVVEIELGYVSAVIVPDIMDYIYGVRHDMQLLTQTAVSVRFLARFFGVRLLNREIMQFICEDMTLQNVAVYAEEAKAFHDEKVGDVAAQFCAQKILDISVDSDLLQQAPPHFFLRIMSSSAMDRMSSSQHLSMLLVRYHSMKSADIPDGLLHLMIHPSNLPHIHLDATLDMLKVARSVEDRKNDLIVSLQRRCVNTIEANWSIFRDRHRDRTFEELQYVESDLVADLFNIIEDDYYQREYKTMSVQSKLVKKYRAQLADAEERRERELHMLRSQMEKERATVEEELETVKSRLRQYSSSMNRRSGRSAAGSRRISRRRSGVDNGDWSIQGSSSYRSSDTATTATQTGKSSFTAASIFGDIASSWTFH